MIDTAWRLIVDALEHLPCNGDAVTGQLYADKNYVGGLSRCVRRLYMLIEPCRRIVADHPNADCAFSGARLEAARFVSLYA